MGDQHSHSSWLSFAGTAIGGLAATLNGLNGLYNASQQVQAWDTRDWEVPALAGSMVGGAAALTGGIVTAAKIGGPPAFASIPTLGLGAGCLYISAGFIYLILRISRLSTEHPPRHAPKKGTPEALEYPSPEWLSTRVLNWGVIGRVGSGKSTLINSLRGLKAQDPQAAPVGVGHTTRRPRPYNFTGDVATLTHNMARLWDLPGAGTRDWPYMSYIRDAGLRHFDGVVCVTSGAFTEAELISQLLGFKVPYYIVRNKVDQDATNNLQDNGVSVPDTMNEIKKELTENGCDPTRTFLISAKHPECADYDFGLLLRAMAADVAAMREELPEFQDQAVPVPSTCCGVAAPTVADTAVPTPAATVAGEPRYGGGDVPPSDQPTCSGTVPGAGVAVAPPVFGGQLGPASASPHAVAAGPPPAKAVPPPRLTEISPIPWSAPEAAPVATAPPAPVAPQRPEPTATAASWLEPGTFFQSWLR